MCVCAKNRQIIAHNPFSGGASEGERRYNQERKGKTSAQPAYSASARIRFTLHNLISGKHRQGEPGCCLSTHLCSVPLLPLAPPSVFLLFFRAGFSAAGIYYGCGFPPAPRFLSPSQPTFWRSKRGEHVRIIKTSKDDISSACLLSQWSDPLHTAAETSSHHVRTWPYERNLLLFFLKGKGKGRPMVGVLYTADGK